MQNSFVRGRVLAAVAMVGILRMCCFGAEYGFDLRTSKPHLSTASAEATTDGLLRSASLPAGTTDALPLAVGDRLSFRIFDDVETVFKLKERTESPLGGAAFLAAADDDDVLAAVVLQDDGGITVNYTDCERGRVYTIVSTTAGVTVREIDPNAGICESVPAKIPELDEIDNQKMSLTTMSDEQSSNVLDILVAFDRNAAAWADRNGGGITNFATMAVQKMNTALGNTGLSERFRFRLVGVLAVNADGGSDLYSILDCVTYGTDEWTAVGEMRDAVGADVVSMLIDTGSAYGIVGLGWALGTSSIAGFSRYAYNACAIRSVAQGHTMTHELGHNLGAGHSDRQTSSPGPQLYGYSAGHYFTANSRKYCTIMAYTDDGKGSSYTRIPFFSSPNHTYCGVAVGDFDHDNTKTIEQTYREAIKWREQKVPLTYDVFFSPEGGSMFDDEISVELTTGKAGAPIFYTLDGSTPTTGSALYIQPIRITDTTTIRAFTLTGGVASRVFEATYVRSGLGAGVDAPQLVWRTDPNYPWTVQTTNTYDGVDALQSGIMPTGRYRTSWLKTDITGPTTISFRYKLYMLGKSFTVTSDNEEALLFSDEKPDRGTEWRLGEVEIPEGKHTISFNFNLGNYLSGFNGVILDQMRFDALSRPPSIWPATSTDQSEAVVFTNAMSFTLQPPPGKAGAIYYTIDDTDPTGEGGQLYTGPVELSASALVRAVFIENEGKDPSIEARGLYVERHPVAPGEWTTDAEGVRTAAAEDGRLVCVLYACCREDSTSRALYQVATSSAFLSWAAENHVYLVTCDDSIHCDTKTANEWFLRLRKSYGESASFATDMFFAIPANGLDVAVAKGQGGKGNLIAAVSYAGTVETLVAGFLSAMGETVPSAPTTSSPELFSSYPTVVTLSNPNEGGLIYYTLDGTMPTRENGIAYSGPIVITEATTLKAVVIPDVGHSGLVLAMALQTFEECLGTRGIAWSSSDGNSWVRDGDSDRTVKSAYVKNTTYESWIKGEVKGRGRLVFTLKYAAITYLNSIFYYVNDSRESYYNGSGEVTVTNEVTSTGSTTFMWEYYVGREFFNYSTHGAQLTGVQWLPEVVADGETQYTPSGWTTPIVVDCNWLLARGLAKAGDSAAEVAARLAERGKNGIPRYQSYILGLEPDSETPAREQLKVTIDGFDPNGVPIISCSPMPKDKTHVTVKRLGRKTLPTFGDARWSEVDGDESAYNFFRVRVEVK